MKIFIEVTTGDLKEMMCVSAAEFEKQIRHQLDNGIVDDEGSVGGDWLVPYQLEVKLG